MSGIRIDPDDFTLHLMGPGGSPLPSRRLSAGERQLLAVSLLWGLARASGRPLPAVIDTPLGRLDSIHRVHLVKRYLPHASHQVVVLSTDEEIDERHHKSLKPWISQQYRLQYDETAGATSIERGYLF